MFARTGSRGQPSRPSTRRSAVRASRLKADRSTPQSPALRRRAAAPATWAILAPPNSPTSRTHSHPHSRPFSWSRCAWVTCPTNSEPTPTVAPGRAAVGFRGRDAIRTFSPSIRLTSPFSQTTKQRGKQMSDLSGLHGIYPPSLRWNAERGFSRSRFSTGRPASANATRSSSDRRRRSSSISRRGKGVTGRSGSDSMT